MTDSTDGTGSEMDPAVMLKRLQSKAHEMSQQANARMQWVAENEGLDPFQILVVQMQVLIDWIMPPHLDSEHHAVTEVPTNPTRLMFDIATNQSLLNYFNGIQQASVGLTVVKNDAAKPN